MSILRKFLLPFSLLYGLVIRLRNWFYDKKILSSFSYSTPVIVVGNLSVGGTGKSPMIEYLLNLLLPQYKIATLSRGYGRKTKGYIELHGKEAAETVGDEPLQFKTKFPEAVVAVDENRKQGIERIVSEYQPEVILLDDAFQHRKIQAGFNILLTSFDNIYSEDRMLPTGNLREPKSGAVRADVIVVTKSPENLSLHDQEKIGKKLKIKTHQQLFFSYIEYSDYLLDGKGRNIDPALLAKQKIYSGYGNCKAQATTSLLKLTKPEF
ncbi:tetraacyldisaccharide 4'-kinase [Antarcticibacterium sp. 1MA-6-2]|uniref:tetraacyldisaccharide 4'-kinase n=1 Tax=Antarcticibacterium sp. 1MA-6-2 TaxID=2908210 RepID=UPI002883577D|nr:tetraacyldisaccharide 4'-kinase [Antarcticibacterium sp. 1MA-6-2]